MNAEKNTIRLLCVTALLLLGAVVFLPKPASGELALKDNDYIVLTFKSARGSDALYIADTRLGMIGVFEYDPAARQIQPRAVRPIMDAFGGAGGR